MPPEPVHLDVRRGYDRWAATYDDRDPTTQLDEPVVRRLVGPVAGRWVLDVGCGTGRYVRLLASEGAKVVGVDLSWRMLARARAEGDAAAGRWVQARVDALPVADRAFDVVVSGLVIDHLPELGPFFGEVARVLRQGGRAIITGVHPARQRRTGADVTFRADAGRYAMPGTIHDPEAVRRAADTMHLRTTDLRTLRLDASVLARRPDWHDRLGYPSLFVIALVKSR